MAFLALLQCPLFGGLAFGGVALLDAAAALGRGETRRGMSPNHK